MLARLGLAGRLVGILLLTLVAAGLLAIAANIVSRSRDAQSGIRLPLPDQAAAIVDLIETSPKERRAAVLRAVNSDDLRVTIEPAWPAHVGTPARFPAAEWLIARYLAVFDTREIEVAVLVGEDSTVLSRVLGRMTQSAPLRIVVGLKSHDYVVLQSRGGPTQRLLGVPTGFWIGVLGLGLAVGAVIAVRRETQPVDDLTVSVQRFSANATPSPVSLRGAPDIRALIGAVNEMQGRIAALLKGRTMLLGAISHDLRTYITRLRLRAELIPDDELQAKTIRDLDDMAAVIDDAIALAKGSAVSDRRERVDLAGLAQTALAELPMGERIHAACAVHRPAFLEGDPVALRRVIDNVLTNARNHARARVDLSLSRGATAWSLTVDDDGPGIPADEREAVLEPFYRLEQSRSRDTGGSGLGLAIAKQIVAAHDGSISISSSPLGGARINITLPMR